MKKIATIVVCLLLFQAIELSAQPKSINYKKEIDFFVNVIDNPNFSLGDFLLSGLRSSNTQFLSYDFYSNNAYCKRRCTEEGINIKTTYDKISACWKIFLIIENQDWRTVILYLRSDPYNTSRPSIDQIDPVLKHRVSIVPLKLEEY